MARIALFLLTNLAVLMVASITLNLIGFDGFMAGNGVDLDLSQLLFFCAIFGISGSVISLLVSKWVAKRAMKVKLINEPGTQRERWLIDSVRHISDKAGIGMPEVGIFQSQDANAFATGWNRNNALVAVSTGMVERFSSEEVEAVLGHEIGHVANGDMVTLTLLQGVVNTFVMFFSRIIGHTVDRVIFKNQRGHGIAFYVTTFVSEIFLTVFASMIVAKFSRWREYRADAAGATLVDRRSMISALSRLKSEQQVPSSMSNELAAFGIRNASRHGFKALFSTHPPLESRIARLESMI